MVRDVTSTPPIVQNYGRMGGGNDTQKAKSHEPITLPQMNGILDELGLGTLGGKVEKFVMKGSGEDAPRTDGSVGKRSDAVKEFFSGVGDKLGGMFSKIGKGFQTAFEAIKGVVTSAVSEIKETFAKLTEAQGRPESSALRERRDVALKEFGEEFSKTMEGDYKAYTTSTDDQPPKTRSEFLRSLMPPPGGTIDKTSVSYIGNRIDILANTMAPTTDPDLLEMRLAVVDVFKETPTLDIAHGMLFKGECDCFDSNPATFLRGNTAFTKLDKFEALAGLPLASVSENVLGGQLGKIEEHGHLGSIDGKRMGMSSLTQEQAVAVLEISNGILDQLLDISPDNKRSFANSIDQAYRDQLSGQAQQIVDNDSLTAQEKKSAINMMYANSMFLRTMSPELINVGIKNYGGTDNQTMVVQTLQFVQTFLNGAADSFGDKANQTAVDAMNQLSQTHQPRLEAFFQAIGMPMVNDQQAN